MSSRFKFVVVVTFATCAGIMQSRAAQKQPSKTPRQQSSAAPRIQSVTDPARAIHDVSVGKFYMNQDDYAGAIARFKDALRFQPRYAEACLLLGRAYEKSNDPQHAIIFYRKYMQILPNTGESKKVRKRIAALRAKVANPTRRRHSGAH